MNNIHEFYFCQTDRLKNSNGSTNSKSATTEHLRLFGLLIKFKAKQNKIDDNIFLKKSDAVYSGSTVLYYGLLELNQQLHPAVNLAL